MSEYEIIWFSMTKIAKLPHYLIIKKEDGMWFGAFGGLSREMVWIFTSMGPNVTARFSMRYVEEWIDYTCIMLMEYQIVAVMIDHWTLQVFSLAWVLMWHVF